MIKEILNKVHKGNAKDVLKTFPAEFVDMCVTSPPYWCLRSYKCEPVIWGGKEDCEHEFETLNYKLHSGRGDAQKSGKYSEQEPIEDIEIPSNICKKCGAWKGQLGLENTPEKYIQNLCSIFDEVWRVLKPTGSLWVNIADSHIRGGGDCGSASPKYSCEAKQSMNEAVVFKTSKDSGYPKKSLALIPEMFCIEMRNRGWVIRNVCLWKKENCMPASCTDRFTIDFEYFFFFVKQGKYYFEQQFEPLKESTLIRDNYTRYSKKYNNDEGHSSRAGLNREPIERTRRIFNVKQSVFVEYLKPLIKGHEIELDNEFGEYKWRHWIRTDESGSSLPEVEDWIKVKEILNLKFDNDDVLDDMMTLTETYIDSGTQSSFYGRNKRCVWTINTKPLREKHYAAYPTELVETPIKACCPLYVCTKCGEPRNKIIKRDLRSIGKNTVREGEKLRVTNSISEKTTLRYKISRTEEGYTDCGCNAVFEPGIVLDPFLGSGTTAMEAENQRKNWIGIDLSDDYIDIANRRIERNRRKNNIYTEEQKQNEEWMF